LKEEIASLVELAKAYMASRPYKVAPVVLAKAYMASRPYKVVRRQDLVLHNNATKIPPKIANGFENGFTTPRSRGRSPLYHMARPSYARSLSTFTQKKFGEGDLPRLLSYPLNEAPLKLLAEPPYKKRAFRTSVPGSVSALAAYIVATSTLPEVSRTPAVVEPPQKKCVFQMSAPEDDSFEIDDALAEPKALESTRLENYTVSDSVTTNGHAKLTESNKAANVCGNLDAPASTAPTNGIFSFGTTTSSLFNFSSPHVSSMSIACTDTTTTVISTTTTSTPAAILSTSTPMLVIPSSVPALVFSFWSATSTTPTISEAETGNTSVRNDKDLKSNSPFASTPISITTTTGSGLFGFSSPTITSTTNNQLQASFFNISNGSQANTQAYLAVTPSMPFLFGSRTTSIPSSTSRTSPFSSPASTSSSFGDPKRAYGFGTTYNDHTSTKSMEENSMQTSTPIFDISVDSMVAEDTHVHGADMSVDGMTAEDTHVHGTDMSVDGMVAEDTHVHGTDMSVENECGRTQYCLHLQMPKICVALGSWHFVFLQSMTPSLHRDLNEFLKDTTYLVGIELNAGNRSAAKECYLRTKLCLEGAIPNINMQHEQSEISRKNSKCIRGLWTLEGLILKGNQLEGELPHSLSKCRYLSVIDLGNNHLNGTFPGWSEDLPNLQVLVLKSNKFHGHIQPSSAVRFPFPNLQVLDLSHNRFVGYLPAKYFQYFNSMKNVVNSSPKQKYLYIGGKYYAFVVPMKGVDPDIPRLFVNLKIIDLSNNYFDREIPNIIGNMSSLKVLNLSHNHLNSQIPYCLGNLSEIESLDLSLNQLTGEIPGSLAGIKGLAVLPLSYNRLVGRIPDGTQFNTFDENSFQGNVGLCGYPLPKKCSEYTQKPQLEACED
nr:leucine-rich repeat-containing protein [Tanacetum cinerariifolium]